MSARRGGPKGQRGPPEDDRKTTEMRVPDFQAPEPKVRPNPARPVVTPARPAPDAPAIPARTPLRATLQALDTLPRIDTLMLLLSDDERPLQGVAGLVDWRMCGRLTELLVSGAITGARGERVLTHTVGRLPVQRVIVFGCGPQDGMLAMLRSLLPELERVLADARCERVALAAHAPGDDVVEVLSAAPRDLQQRIQVVLDDVRA